MGKIPIPYTFSKIRINKLYTCCNLHTQVERNGTSPEPYILFENKTKTEINVVWICITK